MFVVTMAPCYGADQSRYVFGEPYTFVVFQPDSAFDRVVKPGNHGLISASTRREIRARYGGNGRAYDSAISSSPFEAYRFIKPLAVGDAPVRWWDTQAESGPADDYA
jgi:hypothetical protein